MLSDRQVLRRLLESERVAHEEREVARRLLDDLLSGNVDRLSPADRAWAERLILHHRLGRLELGGIAINRAKPKARELAKAFDAMPRPKKPPGKL